MSPMVSMPYFGRTRPTSAGLITSSVICALAASNKSNSVLGLATGSTPVGTYKELVAMYNNGEIDFKDITTVNLDEYKGLDPKNDQSYRYFMQKIEHAKIRSVL